MRPFFVPMTKVKLTHREKVVYILNLARGDWLSLKDIRKQFESRYGYIVDTRTITRAIKSHNYLGGNISESTDRRGVKKQPVKVFTIFPEETQLQ